MENFILNYIADSKRYYYHTYPRDAEYFETQKLFDQYKEKLKLLDRPQCDYLIGKTVAVTVSKKYIFAID